MASWIEIERVRKDPTTFKRLAKKLSEDLNCEDSDFADGFLENISNWKRDEISLRQAEVLLEMRDATETHFKYKGLSIALLMKHCYEGRFELDEGDRERIEALVKTGRSYVTGKQIGWFKRICKQLGEMEEYM